MRGSHQPAEGLRGGVGGAVHYDGKPGWAGGDGDRDLNVDRRADCLIVYRCRAGAVAGV